MTTATINTTIEIYRFSVGSESPNENTFATLDDMAKVVATLDADSGMDVSYDVFENGTSRQLTSEENAEFASLCICRSN